MSTHLPTRDTSGLSVSAILPGSRPYGCDDLRITSCSGSWSECVSGDLFVAIDSEDGDGHDFAQSAVERGAAGVVSERLLALDVPQFLVDDSRRAFGNICHALAGNPAERLTSIAVSGSDGKTVTSHLIRSVLETAGELTGLSCSTCSEEAGDGFADAATASECPARLASWLNQQVMTGRNAAIVEAPSNSLARHALSGARFDIAVVTNIRNDLSRKHGSDLNYRKVQRRIFANLKPTGIAIINADDPVSHGLLQKLSVPFLTIGMRQLADITGKILESDSTGQTICITAGNDSAVVRTSIIGIQHVYNCLAAAAVGLARNIDVAQIARGLELASAIPGRLERVECGQGFNVWIDSAHNPSQIASAIHAVRQVTRGRVLTAVTMLPNQSSQQRKRIGELVQKRSALSVITLPDCSKIEDYEPAHQFLDGVSQHDQVRLIPNRMDAIEWLLSQARPGDSVLVTGVGERPIAVVGDQNQWSVSDKDLVQAWLYDEMKTASPEAARRAQIYRMQDYLQ